MSAASVLDSTRAIDEGAHVLEVKVDAGGGDTATTHHFSSPGDDSPPLPGDSAAIVEGAETDQAVGYADTVNEGKAVPGEKRMYARDSSGAVVGEVWLRADGTVQLDIEPDDAAAVASLVLSELTEIKAQLTALQGFISAAAATETTALGLGGMAALLALLPTWPAYTPASVASATVLIKKP